MARGDRLEVERRLVGSALSYIHHGIEMGDGTVIHACPHDFRNPFGGGSVERTSLEVFADGGIVRRTIHPPAAFPPDEVAARAESQLGRDGYCPLVDNCEHFATWCATGMRRSRQVDIIASRIQAVATRSVAAVSARVAAGTAERVVVRTALGSTVRVGLKTLVPAAIAAEAAALAAEWQANRAGLDEQACRRAGDRAGMATSALAFAVAGAAGGPPGMVAGALAGIAVWAGGAAVATAATRALVPRQSPR